MLRIVFSIHLIPKGFKPRQATTLPVDARQQTRDHAREAADVHHRDHPCQASGTKSGSSYLSGSIPPAS